MQDDTGNHELVDKTIADVGQGEGVIQGVEDKQDDDKKESDPRDPGHMGHVQGEEGLQDIEMQAQIL